MKTSMRHYPGTDEEVARECERRFQNGGPRIYVYDEKRSSPFNVRPSHHKSGKQAVSYAFKGEHVYQRRRVSSAWRFVKIGEGS